MTTQEKIHYLQSICKEEVVIFINGHYNNHEPIEEYALEAEPEIDTEILDGIKSSGVVYYVVAYPGTQVGSYRSVHYDLDKAVDDIIEACKKYHKIL